MYRALDENGPAPYEWVISRVCEEFGGVLPSAAVREMENDPERLALTIIGMRAFAGAKDTYDRYAADKNPKKKPLPKSRSMDLVKEIDLRVAKEKIAVSKAAREDDEVQE